jgi:hypothetical protein
MDRFEQLTAYFAAASDFHQFRDNRFLATVALTMELPDLLAKITQPTLRCRLHQLIISNSALISTPSTGA